MRKLSTGEARENFADVVNDAAYGAKRTVITRHGKEIAAVVPVSDLQPAPASIPEGAVMMQILQSPEIVSITVEASAPSMPPISVNWGDVSE